VQKALRNQGLFVIYSLIASNKIHLHTVNLTVLFTVCQIP
jgi:hypothetical protein